MEMDTANPELADVSQKEMSFWDHLEELRMRLIWSLVGIAIGTIICAVFADAIVNKFLLSPAIHSKPPLKIQNLKPYGQLMLYMELVFIAGLILSLPNTLYQFWKFVQPALYPNERKYVSSIVFFSTFFFLVGGAFGYFILIPNALGFFSGFGSPSIENIIDVQAYFGFITGMILACGVVFELPMLSFFLAKIGILSPQFLKKYRRHAIILILLVAAAITPGPDVASQIMVAIPLYLLYEVSIFVVKFVRSSKAKKEEAAS
ncbi:MAG TPA: twin-arginine translocase subunit TatC [Candidatus Kryptonia bacterium]